jgi:phosphinothricin acetyltransferase
MIRDASDADLPAIVQIFNQLLATTTIEWTDEVHTVSGRHQWLHEHRERGDPVVVAVDDDGDDGDVVGVAAYGDFRDVTKWPGYRFTVEHSVHVRQDRWGRGIGRSLMDALVERARLAGKHVIVGAIDADNVASIEFHRRIGFVEVARMPEVGFKHDRWLGLVFVQRVL